MKRNSLLNPFYISHKEMSKVVQNYAGNFEGSLLDIGCGQKPYESLFSRVEEYIGLEIEPDEFRDKNKMADFYYDGRTLPFESGRFDNVVCFQVLEHVEDYNLFLKEIARVLKPNGKLMLSLPFMWPEHEMPYDFRRFNETGLKLVLGKMNLVTNISIKVTTGVDAYLQLFLDMMFHSGAPKVFKYVLIVMLNAVSSFLIKSKPDHRIYLDVFIIARSK